MGSSTSKTNDTSLPSQQQLGMKDYLDLVQRVTLSELQLKQDAVRRDSTLSLSLAGNRKESLPALFEDSESREILESFPPWKLQDFGLGRGVDGSEERPWTNKSAFQVRKIIREEEWQTQHPSSTNLICTDEGGALNEFEEEVISIKEQKAKLKASVSTTSSPVTVNVGSDLSRSLTTTQRTSGRRILTRTIAFKADFQLENEEQLAQYILECSGEAVEMGNVEKLANNTRLIRAFVDRYHVTHYVSSVTLGASRYRVMSDYSKKIEFKSEVGIDANKAGKVESSVSFLDKLSKKSSNVYSVGKLLDEGVVEREAVVDMTLEPISNLIRNPRLKRAVQYELEHYIRKRESEQEGPFVISCDNSNLFLRVLREPDGQQSVYATQSYREASHFFITLTDEGQHSNEFYIGWKEEHRAATYSEDFAPVPVMHYLEAPLNVRGRNRGPLHLKTRGKREHSLFLINDRLRDSIFKHTPNVDPDVWVRSRESYLIRSTQNGGIDGFLAVKRNRQEANPRNPQAYKTVCRPSTKREEKVGVFMDFQLHPANTNRSRTSSWSTESIPETPVLSSSPLMPQNIAEVADGGDIAVEITVLGEDQLT